ncbi:hypothetical protein Tco_0703215 [Tanacetum coccineum]|uniref:Uncharacterized protein n=1 Tax=Tanacetum coccineum TaxID=301880 RepID=A0ABQ4XY71_9ASTR
MAKLILNEARAEQNLAEPSIKSNVKHKLGEELLKELRCNSYSGRVEEDVVGHVAKILEILDSIEVAGMELFQLRMKNFPLSLSGKARKWWMNEGDGKINLCDVTDHIAKVLEITEWIKFLMWIRMNFDYTCSQNHLVEMPRNGETMKEQLPLGRNCAINSFINYPLSHTYKSKIPDNLDHGMDYFEFLYWLASKFDNYWELDKNVKSGLWELYVNGRTKGTIDDIVIITNHARDEAKRHAQIYFSNLTWMRKMEKTSTKL